MAGNKLWSPLAVAFWRSAVATVGGCAAQIAAAANHAGIAATSNESMGLQRKEGKGREGTETTRSLFLSGSVAHGGEVGDATEDGDSEGIDPD